MTLPQQMLVEARLPSQPLADPAAEVAARLGARLDDSWSGRRVAVAAGSRGIDQYGTVVAAVVATLKASLGRKGLAKAAPTRADQKAEPVKQPARRRRAS